ncbi:L2 protein [Phodopus sungorus papillomavirus 1]|uniref:Minor capsid protein L2 n=1 Tax=Phodopus sungorus papillomavirus 1 TaxID=1487796 RepID=W8ZM63_9PAPI|nr:L2 protein [Phodopus sungorus papillomavirus 1]QWC92937.1 L2 [Phodopus sungorus papillomavirus 1]QWC92943.1 L2 [Phodopus sungorus papillomavirus 1]QWC92949.1 L2 [Phodopus sungorus papillomavirus 1]CDN67543.1 L2 protein [Phodopus sungorus papillomavirus 1]
MVAVNRARRTKRDSASNLYRQCQVTGNCPPDVVNKIEGTTLADKLSKIFASILYLGGLGIGTGRGSGGATGYGPINPGGGRITGTGTVMRPGVVIDPVGPNDIITVGATDSSIVPLLEATPDIPIEGGPEVPPAGPDVSTVDVTANVDPISEVNVTTGSTITNPDSAVIDVQPAPSGPRRVTVSRSEFQNASYVSVTHPSQGLGESGGALVSADSSGSFVSSGHELDIGIIIGERPLGETNFEAIELDEILTTGGTAEFDIGEGVNRVGPSTSTPDNYLGRALSRFREIYDRPRDLYNRRVQQVRVRNRDQFLGAPGRLVTYEFDNPAFAGVEDEVSLIFQQDLNEVQAAPDTDFMDIIRLGRERIAETADGTVRISRLGQRGTIRTRSGLQIGGKVHFYTDLSPIATENIELSTLGEVSGESMTIDALNEYSLISESGIEPVPFPDEDLLDVHSEDFSGSRLHIFRGGNTRFGVVYEPSESLGARTIFPDIDTGDFVRYPQTNVSPADIPGRDLVPVDPGTTHIVGSEFSSVDYYLHPSLRRRKRKRNFH